MKHLLAVFFGTLLIATGGMAAEPGRELTKKEVKELLTKASTPQDHLRLAQHFALKAKKYEAESAEHAELAKLYHARPTASDMKRPMAPDTAVHCDYFADSLAKAAKEARAVSAAHEEMAKR